MEQLQNIEINLLDSKEFFKPLCSLPDFEKYFIKNGRDKYLLFSYDDDILNIERTLNEFENRFFGTYIAKGANGCMISGYRKVIQFLDFISQKNALNLSDYSREYLRNASTALSMFYPIDPSLLKGKDLTLSLIISFKKNNNFIV